MSFRCKTIVILDDIHSTELTFISGASSLADAVGEQDLLHLASHPSLRRISLWFSLKEKFERCAQHLEEMTQYRLTVRFDASMTRIHRDMYKIY